MKRAIHAVRDCGVVRASINNLAYLDAFNHGWFEVARIIGDKVDYRLSPLGKKRLAVGEHST